MQRENFGDIDPGDAVCCCAEGEHVLTITRQLILLDTLRLGLRHELDVRRAGVRTVKKKATLPLAVAFARSPPRGWKLSRMAIIIMLAPQPKLPHIIGFLRPVLSSVKVGKREPMKNMRLMTPPRRRERLRSRPTLSSKTEVM